jgi:hypothetical protein
MLQSRKELSCGGALLGVHGEAKLDECLQRLDDWQLINLEQRNRPI